MVKNLGLPYLGGARPGPPLKDQQQEARWATISVSEKVDRVGEMLRRAVDEPFDEISGTQTKRGFVLARTQGQERTVCEVQLAGWRYGTQIQLVVPRDRQQRELKEFHDWVRKALSKLGIT